MFGKVKPSGDPSEELAALRARVAELERTEARLLESEQRFRDLFTQSPISLAFYDADSRFADANRACLDLFGIPDVASVKHHRLIENPNLPDEMKAAVRDGRPARCEFDFDFGKAKALKLYPTTKSGTLRLDMVFTPILRQSGGRPAGYMTQIQDVTEHRAQKAQLDRLTRTVRAQSRSNQAMMRATSESAYLQEICRIIVEDCGYKLVWIGLAEQDARKTVWPAAYSGFEEGYTQKLDVTWADDAARGRGPTGTAIRTGKLYICRNILTDPNFAPWREDALKRGYASSVALPLLSESKALGAIMVYGAEPDAFSEEEIHLLSALADDLAFGITSLRLRAAHERTEERVRGLALFPDENPNPVVRISREGTILYANHASAELLASWESRVGGAAPEEQHRAVLAVLSSGRAQEIEIPCGRKVFSFEFAPFPDRNYTNLYGRDVTEHKVADEKLRESEETFHAIFDKAATGIALADLGLRLWETNPAYREMVGYTAAELRGRNVVEITHPDDRQEEEKRVADLLAGRRVSLRVEKRFIHKDGHTIFASITRSVCRDAAGKPQFFIALVEDITARKQAEEALQVAYHEMEMRVQDRTADLAKANEGLQAEIEERLRAEQSLRQSEETVRALLNATTDAMLLMDAQANILAVNESAAQRWGKSAEEIIGRSVYEFLAPEVARTRKTRFEDAARSGAPVRFEDQHRSAWWDTTVYPVRDAAGKVSRLAVFGRDITERKRAETALQESRQRADFLADVVEKSADAFAVGYPDGHIGLVNHAFEQLTGYSREELKHLRWDEDLTPPEWRESEQKQVEELDKTGQPVRYEKEYIRKDGTRVPIELLVHLVRDADGRHAYCPVFLTDITERKKAEEALRESEARFRTAFENGTVGMALTAPDGRMLEVNHTFCRMVGYSEAELANRPFAQITHPDDLAPNLAGLEEMVRGKTLSFRMEKRYIHKSGSVVWTDMNTAAVRDKAGRLLYQVTHIQDITERKRAEEALRASEARFRTAFENGAVGMVLIETDDRMFQINPALCRMLGYSEAELVNRRFFEITHPDDVVLNRPAWEATLRGEAPAFRIEKRFLRKNGSVMWGDINTAVVRDAAGRPLYYITHFQDITERKLAEEALRASETRFRTAFENGAVGMALMEPDGRMFEVNPALCRMLGYSEAELVNRRFFQITHPDDLVLNLPAWEAMWRGETSTFRVEKRFLHKNGSVVWGDINTAMVRDEGGQPIYEITHLQDITERKRAEEALRASEVRFRAAFENGAVGMALTAPDERMLEVNTALCRMVGYSEAELLNYPFDKITHPDDLVLDGAGWEAMLRGETPCFRMEKRLLHKNGSVVWADMNTAAVRDADGRRLYQITHVQDITERKRAEAALRESEARFRTAFENGAVGMTLASPDGRMLQVNPAFCRMVRYSAEELVNRPFIDIAHPDDAAANLAGWRATVRGEMPSFRMEKRVIRKDGAILWEDMSTAAVRDADGRLLYNVTYVQDITERKHAEQALRESETRFRNGFENGPVGMVLMARGGRMLAVNPALCRMVGYSEAELVNLPFNNIIHPDDLALDPAGWEAMKKGETPSFRIEKRFLHKSGSVVWGSMSTAAVRDEGGQPLYYITHIQDITERKRVEESLRKSEARYRALFEESPVAVKEYDCSGLLEYLNQLARQGVANVQEYLESHPEETDRCFATMIPVDANRAAVKLLKARDRDDVLKNIASVLCDETRQYFRAAVAGIPIGRTSFASETALRTFSGDKREVWISSTFIPGQGGGSPTVVIAVADLTELRSAEREAARQRETAQLQRVESLAATGRLAAGVAHEINNPLQAIMGQLSLLALDVPATPRNKRRLELINGAVEKMAKIVSSLLLLHRPPQDSETSCSASTVIDNVTELIHPQAAAHRIKVEVAVKPEEATIPLSARALTQVPLNLLLNAIDATPADGVIRVEANQTAEETLLLVSDTGAGIAPEHRSKLFSPFFTTKPFKGTGLGLSVTHSLVTDAGGTIDVDSRQGKGATFFVRFPGSEKLKGRKISILIADDHKVVREGLRSLFQQENDMEVVAEAENGEEALELARQYTPDVVIMDVSLPVIDGTSATRILTKEMPQVKVIGLSMHLDDAVANAMRQAGAAAYLTKDGPSDDLIAAVRACAPAKRRGTSK